MSSAATAGGAAGRHDCAALPAPVRPSLERHLGPLEGEEARGSSGEGLPSWLRPFNPDEEENEEGEIGLEREPGVGAEGQCEPRAEAQGAHDTPEPGQGIDLGEGKPETDAMETIEEAKKPSKIRDPSAPTRAQWEEHQANHLPFRSWCTECVQGRMDTTTTTTTLAPERPGRDG